MIFNYVISLSNSIERREHIVREFSKKSIPFRFYDALYPSDTLTNYIDKYFPRLADANLSEGEKACFMSHYMIWKECIEADMQYIFIFEDDILLSDSAEIFLLDNSWFNKLSKDLINRPVILRLETYLMPIKKTKENNLNSFSLFNRDVIPLLGIHYGTAGYIINREAIKYLLSNLVKLESKDIKPIDLIFSEIFINEIDIYQLSPALCVQSDVLYKENSCLRGVISHTSFIKTSYTLKEQIYRFFTKYKRYKEKKILRKTIVEFK